MKIGEAAKRLDCTPATIRNYVKRYPEFLSESASSPRRKQFTDSDIVTLRSIKGHLESGLRYDEISERLSYIEEPEILDTHEQVNTYDEPFSQDTAIVEMKYFDRFQALLEGEREKHNQEIERQEEQHQREISAKDETIELLKDELERARLPWWRKIL